MVAGMAQGYRHRRPATLPGIRYQPTEQAAADFFGLRIGVLSSFVDNFLLEIAPREQKSSRVLWLSFWAEVRRAAEGRESLLRYESVTRHPNGPKPWTMGGSLPSNKCQWRESAGQRPADSGRTEQGEVPAGL